MHAVPHPPRAPPPRWSPPPSAFLRHSSLVYHEQTHVLYWTHPAHRRHGGLHRLRVLAQQAVRRAHVGAGQVELGGQGGIRVGRAAKGGRITHKQYELPGGRLCEASHDVCGTRYASSTGRAPHAYSPRARPCGRSFPTHPYPSPPTPPTSTTAPSPAAPAARCAVAARSSRNVTPARPPAVPGRPGARGWRIGQLQGVLRTTWTLMECCNRTPGYRICSATTPVPARTCRPSHMAAPSGLPSTAPPPYRLTPYGRHPSQTSPPHGAEGKAVGAALVPLPPTRVSPCPTCDGHHQHLPAAQRRLRTGDVLPQLLWALAGHAERVGYGQGLSGGGRPGAHGQGLRAAAGGADGLRGVSGHR